MIQITEDKKLLKKAGDLFISLKTDPSSVVFAEEILNNKLVKRLKKSKYRTDKLLFKLFNDSEYIFDKNKAPIRADFVEKREIDCSTLYSFDSPFQLLHADRETLEFLGKYATFPQYVLKFT